MAKNADPQMIVKPDAAGLAAAAGAAIRQKGPAPVHLWNPPHCGEIDMRIARDGTWFYQGTPIGRPAMVRAFANILRRDPDEYVLVTPVERVRIRVDDAPFVAVDFARTGEGRAQRLTFTTNIGDTAEAGPEHPIRVVRDPATGEPAPYVHIRGGLEALIDRKTFYRLVEIGTTELSQGAAWFGLWSGGVFFPVIPASELD